MIILLPTVYFYSFLWSHFGLRFNENKTPPINTAAIYFKVPSCKSFQPAMVVCIYYSTLRLTLVGHIYVHIYHGINYRVPPEMRDAIR